MSSMLQNLGGEFESIQFMLVVINAILHLVFAGAVARDAGILHKRGDHTFLVTGFTWAFATLLGGVWVVAIYWLLHYSNLRKI